MNPQQTNTCLCFVVIALVAIGSFAANWKLGCIATAIALFKVIKLGTGGER